MEWREYEGRMVVVGIILLTLLIAANAFTFAFFVDQSTAYLSSSHPNGASSITWNRCINRSSGDVGYYSDEDQRESCVSTARSNDPIVQLLTLEERRSIDDLIRERSTARWNGDYSAADKVRARIDETCVVIPWERIMKEIGKNVDDLHNILDAQQRNEIGLECRVTIADVPRSEGGLSSWGLTPTRDLFFDYDASADVGNEDNVLRLAHAALGLSVSASERGVVVDIDIMNGLVRRAANRLQLLKRRRRTLALLLHPEGSAGVTVAAGELHGRKAADAALWFALSGVDNVGLFDDLIDITTDELRRFGRNPGCRAKDVLHIIERIAMAGIDTDSSRALYRVAANCLEAKMTSADEDDDGVESNIDYEYIISSLSDNSFGLHSDRSLLGLWRFSTRQRKQRSFFENAARHFDSQFRGNETTVVASSREDQYNWSAIFEDPSRPLVVDIGCGMGVSLLGLASSSPDSIDDQAEIQIDWSQCNFIGIDLSHLTIGYGQSVRSRCGLGNLAFVVDSAENCLIRICTSYPGKVALAMIQFATPYRFQDDVASSRRGFNSQLPDGAASDDFMVSENLLSRIHYVLSKSKGHLLIQSNCEDVAVHIRNVATKKVGFKSRLVSHPVASLVAATQRAERWVAVKGERPIGEFWSSGPLLPLRGRTETEVACMLDSKSVHRCLLEA